MQYDADELQERVEAFYETDPAPFKDAKQDAVLDLDTPTETGYEAAVIKAAQHCERIVNGEVDKRHWRDELEDAIADLESAVSVASEADADGATNQFSKDRKQLLEIYQEVLE